MVVVESLEEYQEYWKGMQEEISEEKEMEGRAVAMDYETRPVKYPCGVAAVVVMRSYSAVEVYPCFIYKEDVDDFNSFINHEESKSSLSKLMKSL